MKNLHDIPKEQTINYSKLVNMWMNNLGYSFEQAITSVLRLEESLLRLRQVSEELTRHT